MEGWLPVLNPDIQRGRLGTKTRLRLQGRTSEGNPAAPIPQGLLHHGMQEPEIQRDGPVDLRIVTQEIPGPII